MNSALLLTDRLCDLTEMALQAYTKFEKATVFAATKAIHEEFRQAAAYPGNDAIVARAAHSPITSGHGVSLLKRSIE